MIVEVPLPTRIFVASTTPAAAAVLPAAAPIFNVAVELTLVSVKRISPELFNLPLLDRVKFVSPPSGVKERLLTDNNEPSPSTTIS